MTSRSLFSLKTQGKRKSEEKEGKKETEDCSIGTKFEINHWKILLQNRL